MLLLEPADRVSTIIELANRSGRLLTWYDQIVAYEHEHDAG